MAIALRQAPKTTRPIMSCYMLCFSILIIALATVNTPALADQVYHSSPPSTLVLYEHQDNVPPDQTFVIVASPSGNLSSFVEFGTIGVISNILRESEANDSRVLGVLNGPAFAERDSNLFTTFTLVLNTESFSGSISAQGVLAQPGNGELAITGGTYDFRWARGYVEITSLSQDPQGAVYKIILCIKYD